MSWNVVLPTVRRRTQMFVGSFLVQIAQNSLRISQLSHPTPVPLVHTLPPSRIITTSPQLLYSRAVRLLGERMSAWVYVCAFVRSYGTDNASRRLAGSTLSLALFVRMSCTQAICWRRFVLLAPPTTSFRRRHTAHRHRRRWRWRRRRPRRVRCCLSAGGIAAVGLPSIWAVCGASCATYPHICCWLPIFYR